MMHRLTSIVSKTSASTSTVSSLPGWGGSGETLRDLSWLGGADRGTREAEGFVRDEKQQMVASRDRSSVSRFSVIQLVQRALAQSRRRREHARWRPSLTLHPSAALSRSACVQRRIDLPQST